MNKNNNPRRLLIVAAIFLLGIAIVMTISLFGIWHILNIYGNLAICIVDGLALWASYEFYSMRNKQF